jgi:hypothetical protein
LQATEHEIDASVKGRFHGMPNIHGGVDRITSKSIEGWIADLDFPDRLESVLVWGDSGAPLSFKATLKRHDICDRLSLDGRFGFAIPLSALHNRGNSFRVSTTAGSVLDNGVDISFPSADQIDHDRKVTWLVQHIQKTAGTSLALMLQQVFDPGEIALVYPETMNWINVEEFAGLPRDQLRAFRCVMGHLYFGIGALIPADVAYVTVVREPMARLRSHYRHHMRWNVSFNLSGTKLPLWKVVQHGLTDEFDNLMTRMISGVPPGMIPIGSLTSEIVDLAVSNIRNHYGYLCLTEKVGEQALGLCDTMGIPAGPVGTENGDPSPRAVHRDALVDWEEVRHHNRFDLMLYDRILNEGLYGRPLGMSRIQ